MSAADFLFLASICKGTHVSFQRFLVDFDLVGTYLLNGWPAHLPGGTTIQHHHIFLAPVDKMHHYVF